MIVGDTSTSVCVSGSVMSDSETPCTVARQAPPSMGFSRQEYRSGLPFPSPGDLSDPGIEPRSPALQLDSEPPEMIQIKVCYILGLHRTEIINPINKAFLLSVSVQNYLTM